MVTPAHNSRRFLSPGDKLGKYEVIRQIAVGGMAELYLTRTVGLEGFEKLVCVKRILPQFINNPSFVNMFLNEARLAATLHHPNIAQVYDIGQEHGEYFFSMEYVHGEDLGRLVATGRENGVPISLDCALTLAAGLCAGLHHAHEKVTTEGKPLGVVHRDVSPTNVLVSYDGAVKLVDFGIARASGDLASQTGLKGKISYMSPEQCRGRTPVDRRSDIFSIGTILYELTTGQLPFTDETEYGVLQQIVNRDADPPSKLVPSYPQALEQIVMRALARDPARRFSTALELQNQLEDFAHDNRLRVSPLVLARLMSTLFPARLEEWDHARAQGAFFVEQHVVRTLIESGKTADSSPRYLPQPLPPADSGALVDPTDPTAKQVSDSEPTQLGPQPRLSPPRVQRGATTPPMPSAAAVPVAIHTPAPVVVPPPAAAVAVAVPTPQPAMRSPQNRHAPVPNMPGAVPIVMPLPAPPVPAGGTLVSSATQAGSPPPPVMPGPTPGAPSGFVGPSSFPGAGAGAPAAGGLGRFGPIPAAADSFGGHGGYPAPGAPGGLAGQGRFAAASSPDVAPGTGHHSIGDVTDRVRTSARPTLLVRRQRRSRLPIVALVLVGAAGAVVGVWLATGGDAGAPSGVTTPAAETATKPAPTKPEIADPRPDPVVAPVAAEPKPDPRAAAAAEPDPAPTPGEPAAEPARVAEPIATPPPPVRPDPPADPGDAKKKPARVGQQEPRTKATKPKARPDARRTDAKRKPENKEQPWNDDSPFMPVATPKR